MAHDTLKYFAYHQLPGHLRTVSKPFCELAHAMARLLPENDQSRLMMLDLLRAKDCAVRSAMDLDPKDPRLVEPAPPA